MTEEAAAVIIAWRYPAPYDFYNLDKDAQDLEEFADRRSWEATELGDREVLLAVHRDGELAGFFSFAGSADCCTIGLGLAPSLTGRSLGRDFVAAGLRYGKERWRVRRFRLEVATFNRRAITVYERLGFETIRTVVRHDGGAEVEFFEMVSGPREDG